MKRRRKGHAGIDGIKKRIVGAVGKLAGSAALVGELSKSLAAI
jgi:hypothetical protein